MLREWIWVGFLRISVSALEALRNELGDYLCHLPSLKLPLGRRCPGEGPPSMLFGYMSSVAGG